MQTRSLKDRIEQAIQLVSCGEDFAAMYRFHAVAENLKTRNRPGKKSPRAQERKACTALQRVLTNAAWFVLPSDLEGLSLALLDAMGDGVCVLASNATENLEALGDTGFTFKPGELEDLGRMLTHLLSDDELCASAEERFKKRMRENFLWGKVVKELALLYTRMSRSEPKQARVMPSAS